MDDGGFVVLFWGFFLQSLQMNAFSAVVTVKDHLLKSLCIHVLVSIIESMTIHKHCTCRVQVPCPPETNRTFSAVIGQRYWHFFLQLLSVNVGRVLQKACVKKQQQAVC